MYSYDKLKYVRRLVLGFYCLFFSSNYIFLDHTTLKNNIVDKIKKIFLKISTETTMVVNMGNKKKW